jgi:hypothetical protein
VGQEEPDERPFLLYNNGMRRLIEIALIGFLILVGSARAFPLSDKALHVLGGASCSLLASSALSPLLLPELRGTEPWQLALSLSATGLGAAILAGVVKELLDLGGFGQPDWLDLAATVAGGLLASAGVFAVTYLAASQGAGVERLAPAYAPFGLMLSIPVSEALIRRLFGKRNSASCARPGRCAADRPAGSWILQRTPRFTPASALLASRPRS